MVQRSEIAFTYTTLLYAFYPPPADFSSSSFSSTLLSYDTSPMSVKTATNSLLAAEISSITANTDSINAMSTESSEHMTPEVATTIKPSEISRTKDTNNLQSSSSTGISGSATNRNEQVNLKTSVSIDVTTSSEPAIPSVVQVTTSNIKPGIIAKLNVFDRITIMMM